MSGILCVHSESGIPQDLPRYTAALNRLIHRGRDRAGVVLRAELFLGVRQSMAAGDGVEQPLVDVDRKVILAFDGCLHNRVELIRDLAGKGWRGDLSGEPAIVAAAYAVYGLESFERFRGVWTLVLWDERSRRLLVGRDRLGVRPLYYYCGSDHLVVASEIKSIIGLDRKARDVDERRVREFIRRGTIDDWAFTCFARIRPVPPATILEFVDGQTRAHQFWRLRPSTDHRVGPPEILRTLNDAVARHVPEHRSIGLALSGGIDSSALAGLLAAPGLSQARRVHAFSITPPGTPDESRLVESTIRLTGIPHTQVRCDTFDYPHALAKVIAAHDEPINYVGTLYQFVLRQHMAAAGCQCALVGYGADEIFAGYPHLAPPFLRALAADGRWRDAARFVTGAREFVDTPVSALVSETLQRIGLDARATLLAPLKQTAAYGMYRRRRQSRIRTADPSDVLSPDANAGDPDTGGAVPSFVDQEGIERGHIFMAALLRCFRTNVALLVRLEDRNASAHGLELAVPFMDDELVETALGLPFHRYMADGRNKAVLRDAAAGILSPEVRQSRKKLNTPGNSAYVSFDALRDELLDILNADTFWQGGRWSRDCAQLYASDSARRVRGDLWFRLYIVHQWNEQVIRRCDDNSSS